MGYPKERKRPESLIISPKLVDILEALIHFEHNHVKPYASIISKRADVNSSHVIRILKIFEQGGLVERGEIKGRIRPVNITDKGREVFRHAQTIIEKLNE